MNRDKRVQLWMSKAEYELIEKTARKKGLNVSSYIRQTMVDDALRQVNKLCYPVED